MAEAKRIQGFYSNNGGRGSIELNLNDNEANFLRTIIGLVGGSPENSPRRHEAPIRKALDFVGAKSLLEDVPEEDQDSIVEGAIYFKDDFEPGYFRELDDVSENPTLRYFKYNPGKDYMRVNVTLNVGDFKW